LQLIALRRKLMLVTLRENEHQHEERFTNSIDELRYEDGNCLAAGRFASFHENIVKCYVTRLSRRIKQAGLTKVAIMTDWRKIATSEVLLSHRED
jgi:hypothetical protein